MTDIMADYEVLPYVSMPFPQTQPAHIAALARLHGAAAPDVEHARVLELGCASGGNLIPLAVRFPFARFQGYDLSARHVREAADLIARLELGNVQVHQADISALDLGGQTFDYIICHGVFSWVPRTVQDAILKICARHLGPDGLAFVSFNTFPGWHAALTLRDICQQHVAATATPQARIAEARDILQRYARLTEGSGSYGSLLREEIGRSLRMSDSHFMGEFLSEHNDPCTFGDFINRSQAAGLSYLCDAANEEGSARSPAGRESTDLSALTEGHGLSAEQARDLATGRRFRRALLTRRTAPHFPRPQLSGLATLHFASDMTSSANPDGSTSFRQGGSAITTNDPVVIAGLTGLAQVFPASRSFCDMVDAICRSVDVSARAAEARLKPALMRLVLSGCLEASVAPTMAADRESPRPAVWSVARAQLELGQDWVCSLRHMPVRLDATGALLASLFDGKATRDQIRARISAAISEGRINVELPTADGQPYPSGEIAARLLEVALEQFRSSALLVGPFGGGSAIRPSTTQ